MVDTGCLIAFELQRLKSVRDVVLGEGRELLKRRVEQCQIDLIPKVAITSHTFPASAHPVTNEQNRFSK